MWKPGFMPQMPEVVSAVWKRLRSWGEDTEAGAMLDTGSGVIKLFANAEPGRKPGQVDHIALATDQVDECMAACAKEGLKIIMPPKRYRCAM